MVVLIVMQAKGEKHQRLFQVFSRQGAKELLVASVARLFLPFPLSASSLRCVCVAHSLSLVAQVVQSVEKHTLGTRFCHIMYLFGL